MGCLCFNLLYVLQEDNEKDQKQKNYKREPIKLYINSNGGAIDDMWSLIDIMLNSKTPIYTYCTGYAMSAGFLIFLAGSKRFMTKTKISKNKIQTWIEKKQDKYFHYEESLQLGIIDEVI